MAEADNRHTANLSELEGLITEKLESGGSVTFSPKGASMLPWLRASGDRVTLEKPPARLKKGTAALFVSKDEDGGRKYVLHRLVRVKGEELIFMGDNRRMPDPPARREDVIGIVTAYSSRGREHTCRFIGYRVYKRWMTVTSRFRRPAQKLQGFLYRIWKRPKG
ncbi:MAG: S24/S26 family peptidase [Clostridia bacterium]|nr:S24/S26 family peptidase [Clostridia bacterium]